MEQAKPILNLTVEWNDDPENKDISDDQEKDGFSKDAGTEDTKTLTNKGRKVKRYKTVDK